MSQESVIASSPVRARSAALVIMRTFRNLQKQELGLELELELEMGPCPKCKNQTPSMNSGKCS